MNQDERFHMFLLSRAITPAASAYTLAPWVFRKEELRSPVMIRVVERESP